MTFQSVCVAWVADLTTNVAALTSATTHLYAPWSPEQMQANLGDRHLAVWPAGEPESRRGLVAGDPPADEVTQTYAIQCWEEASVEGARLVEDPTADLAWIQLYEAIRDRLYVWANVTGSGCLGEAGAIITYQGGAFDLQGSVRSIVIRFTLRHAKPYT